MSASERALRLRHTALALALEERLNDATAMVGAADYPDSAEVIVGFLLDAVRDAVRELERQDVYGIAEALGIAFDEPEIDEPEIEVSLADLEPEETEPEAPMSYAVGRIAPCSNRWRIAYHEKWGTRTVQVDVPPDSNPRIVGSLIFRNADPDQLEVERVDD